MRPMQAADGERPDEASALALVREGDMVGRARSK